MTPPTHTRGAGDGGGGGSKVYKDSAGPLCTPRTPARWPCAVCPVQWHAVTEGDKHRNAWFEGQNGSQRAIP